MTSPESKCATCKKPLAGHYRVTAIGANAQERGTIRTCSVLCLIQWAYSFAAERTTQGAMMVSAAAKDPDTLKQLIKGFVAKL